MTGRGDSTPAPVRRPTWVARIVMLPFHIFGIVIGSLLLAILVEWAGMLFVWPELGPRHAQAMLDHELDQLSTQFRHSLLIRDPAPTARRVVDELGAWADVSGLLPARRAASGANASAQRATHRDFRTYLAGAQAWAERYLMAAGFTILVVAVRALVLVLTLPLFVMAAVAGLIDGLVQRDLRRFSAGRESGFVYHRARASIVPMLVLPWALYLAIPVSVHPLTILLPCAALLGIAVGIAAATFKKYL